MLVLTNTINFLLETQPQNSNLNALLDAISKVKDSSTLIAFIIAASLVALMIVMSSTQGLNRIYDTLLKNTAISGRQFERMFYAILLFMTVLALVLFGFLCFKITQPSQKPVIKITNPSPFSTIEVNNDKKCTPESQEPQTPYNCDLEVTVTTKNIPEGNKIWIVSEPTRDTKYYPAEKYAVENNLEWETNTTLRIQEKEAIYNILAILADKQISSKFNTYNETAKQNKYPGIKSGDEEMSKLLDNNLYDKIQITFRRTDI